jgi:hypothetical protein
VLASRFLRFRIAPEGACRREPHGRVPRSEAPTVAASAPVTLGRRQLLRLAGALIALASVPLVRVQRAIAAARGRFFTAAEMATLEALVDRVLPPDRDPGAAALGAARYVDQLLSAFDVARIPFIFAGGPVSDRNPYPDPIAGRPSRRYPQNAFAKPIALSRLQEIRWRAELFGTDAVPEAAMNDDVLGPLRGLRDVYREALARVDDVALSLHGDRFADLPPAQQDEVFAMLDDVFERDPRRGVTFVELLIQHTIEGCFAAPEYGGNADAAGWRMIGIEGDTHPLGFSIYSRARKAYDERPDHPMSTPNPDEIGSDGRIAPRPLGPDGEKIQASLMRLSSLLGDGC